jgi:hypothetical protein
MVEVQKHYERQVRKKDWVPSWAWCLARVKGIDFWGVLVLMAHTWDSLDMHG